MVGSGNKLLMGFLAFSVLFFATAQFVQEDTTIHSDPDGRHNGTSGGGNGMGDGVDGLASASDPAAASGDHPALTNGQLRLVSTAWSPFTNVPGQPRFALDLVEEALERVGITVETVIVDDATLIPSVLSGDFDGSAALWKKAERERALIYSHPYLENRLILVGRQGSDVSASSLNDLDGKRIALVAGWSYGEAVETVDGPIFVGSDSEEDNLSRLLGGEVDYTLMDDLVIQYLMSNNPEEAQTNLAFGSTPLLTRPLHLAIHRSLPDADSIIAGFNAELRGMMADRTYHRLLLLDWIRTDVDGDGLREYVPYVDQTGPSPPEQFYDLFSSGGPAAETGSTQRYYFSGNVYEGWSSVPERYKAGDVVGPGPRQRTAKLFTFTW